jgi:hypothetical protein
VGEATCFIVADFGLRFWPQIFGSAFMKRRTRKLLGTCLILVFVLVYAPLAMALAESRIMEAHKAVQVLAYIALGLAWVLPVMPLIRWMEKPETTSH